MSELKPCPFCGLQPELKESASGLVKILCPPGGCIGSGLIIAFAHHDKEKAVKAWNTRSADEELTAAYFEASRSAEAIAALQERNADLEDALWPFAEARPRGLAHVPDDAVYAATVKIGDLRRAAALLNKEAS